MSVAPPRSLFGQLVLAQIILMAVMATILPVALIAILNATADSFVAEKLTNDARSIASGGMPGSVPGARLSSFIYDDPRSGRRFAIFDAAGRTVRQGPFAIPLTFAQVERGAKPIFFHDGRYDIISVPRSGPGGLPQWVVVSQDRTVPEEIVDDVVNAFLTRFLWIIPTSLLASLLVGMVVVRRITDKFRRAAGQADEISLHRIDTRILADELPTEAIPLVNATNRALDRLETGYRFQGEFVGNVAHELRTPLALISLRAEGLDPSPERELILAGVQRVDHVVVRLMELAAIDRHYPEIAALDPCAVARETAELMAPLVFRSGRVIEFVEPSSAPPQVEGVSGLLVIALTNLIDNAMRHTPTGTTITVGVDGSGKISVEDDGPGVILTHTAGRTGRLPKRTSQGGSAGLGLSIVGRIMAVCGGRLEIANGSSGGARCVIVLRPVMGAELGSDAALAG